jgi:hypothetical protein
MLSDGAVELLRFLAEDVGERFGGTEGDARAAAGVAERFAALGCEVRTQEFGYVGWRRLAPSRLRTFAPSSVTLPCAPLLHSAPTPPGGVRGRLSRRGTAYLIPGVYELPLYALVDDRGADVGRVIVELDGPAIPLVNPRALFQAPQVVVGSEHGPDLDALAAAGAVAELEVAAELLPGARSRNVIAAYRGAPGERRIVIGAHLDTTLDTPGAYDNASGVAGMYALAERIVAERLPLNVDFVGFACEEQGFLGASHLVNDLKERGGLGSVEAVLNLDQISAGATFWVWAGPDDFARRVMEALRSVPAVAEREIRTSPPMPGADDWPFHLEGIPTVTLILWRLPDYHKPSDTPEKTDPGKMAALLEGAYAIAASFARERGVVGA